MVELETVNQTFDLLLKLIKAEADEGINRDYDIYSRQARCRTLEAFVIAYKTLADRYAENDTSSTA